MNATERVAQLRALLIERSVVSATELERQEREIRRSGREMKLWAQLHSSGLLTQKQAETMEMAERGYVPIEAARMALGNQTPAPSSSASSSANTPRAGGLKIARKGAAATQRPAAAPEAPAAVAESPKTEPVTAPAAVVATGQTARPSPRQATTGASETSSMRFQSYAQIALPEMVEAASSRLPSPAQKTEPASVPTDSKTMAPAQKRGTSEKLDDELKAAVEAVAKKRSAETKAPKSDSRLASKPPASTEPEAKTGGESASSDLGESARPPARSATQLDVRQVMASRSSVLAKDASISQSVGDSRVAALLREKTPVRNMGSLVGRRLGKYQVNSQIGRGASGSVFLAHHVVLNMPVAVKVLDPALAGYHPELLKRFMMEARSAARLTHPNIIRVLDCDQIDGFHIIVMEYVDGISVSELIKINGMVAEERALVIVQSVAEGLEAALESGIIHRDIKPANIMVTKNKQVKLADLGLAKRVDDNGEMSDTRPNIGLGTPHFFAPEQAADASTADHRSDIYSLGATLYNMLTGQVPFKGKSLPDLVRKHAEEPLVPANQLVPAVSRMTSELVVHMMAKRPEDRPKNYGDLLTGIQACIINLKNRSMGDAGSRTNSFVRDLFSGLFNKKP